MTHREFAEWCWVFDVEPFDDQRCFDLPAAMITAHMINLKVGNPDKLFSPMDFMPFAAKPPAEEVDIDAAVIGKL